MGAIALQALAEETGGQLYGESVPIQHLKIDSREVSAGDLFAAICGQHADGHDYVPQAVAAGASAVLTERKVESGTPQLVVSNITHASGRFGYLKRQAFAGDIIAITGSAGKTTTKNLIAAALGPSGAVHATLGNQNNELGVPLTLSGLTDDYRYGVIEMGAGQPGDIAYLCELARPNVSVCVNASAAHLAHYDSVDAIASTKGEIFEGLGGKGLAVINADQKWSSQWRAQAGSARQVTFGLLASADYRATDIHHRGLGGGRSFDSKGRLFPYPCRCNLLAISTCQTHWLHWLLQLNWGSRHSMQLTASQRLLLVLVAGAATPRAGGGMVIDDTYNANPAAVKAALDVLARESGYRVLLLGPMLELGSISEALHTDVGRYAREKGIDLLITVGEEAAPAAEAFGGSALSFPDQTSLHADFPTLPKEHVVWVKGSRAAGLERTVAWLFSAEEATSC